jgi:transcriptional regulator with XRE-family HTH domain
MDKLQARLADRLKKLMVSKGLSQLEIARRTGLTGATVNALCNARGTIVVASVVSVAKELGVSVDDLLAPDAQSNDADAVAEAAAMRALEAFERKRKPAPQQVDIAPKFENLDAEAQVFAAQIREQLLALSTQPRLLTQAALFLQAIVDANEDLLHAQERQKKRS